jgi:hypothetical protein
VDGDAGRDRVRSFLLGGLVGASAVLATVRRRRASPEGRSAPRGLAAFENAPCYKELLAKDRDETR